MDREEFNNLILKAQERDSEALGILVEKNMGLVGLIAQQIKVNERTDDYEGTISEGKIGLIKSINGFDVNNGARFSTYATFWIRAAMNNYINDGYASNQPIRFTRNYNMILTEIIEFKEKFIMEHKRKPSVREVSKGINRSEKSVEKIMTVKKGVLSLDYVSDDCDCCLGDLIESDNRENEDFIINRMVLNESLCQLKEKEQKVIHMRYYEEKTLKDVANILGMSEHGVHLLEKRVFHKLKKMIGSDYRYETSLDYKKRA